MKTAIRLIAAAVIVVLLSLMLGPVLEIEQTARVSDKLAHVAAFFLIAGCIEVLIWRGTVLLSCLMALVIGGLVELIQGGTGRDASWGDFLADFIGVSVAFVVMKTLKPRLDRIMRPGPDLSGTRP
ncbi:VanZ family protein [Brevundimonas sp.]|uniref:VanZ family protein n=1 Tax=Brevundimonas sp. TaxID=1871086 RepID=UPI002489253C|nr:VanZ family protein [Brevundimonas sp.]MDI1282418.1 VanZ family protein [Brevundimonas sp.]